MAENTVGLAELRVMADTFINADFPYFTELKEAFELLKLTGCRIQEIFEIYRWRRLEGNTFELIPQKKNNPRYIILDDTFLSFKTAIDNQFAPFLGRTYSQLQGIFNKVNPYGKLYSGGKEITNYFFRYLYVRELFESGLTLSEIANHMGYGSTTAVNNYLIADLGSTIEVPVIPSDPLPVEHIDIISPFIVFNGIDNGFKYINPFIGNSLSIFIKASAYSGSDKFIMYSGNLAIRNTSFLIAITQTLSQTQISVKLMNGAGRFIIQTLINTTNPNSFNFILTLDYASLSVPPNTYRTAILKLYEKNATPVFIAPVGFDFSRGWTPEHTIADSYSGSSYGYQKFNGRIDYFTSWNRILNETEISHLFNL